LMEHVVHDKKNNMAGQMTLFDIVSDEQKEEFDVTLPKIGEYEKEMLLQFEKEVLGVYVSGHPMEAWQELWEKHVTNSSMDFVVDEETGEPKVRDQSFVTVGGMVTGRNVKYTKNNEAMAFVTIEALVGVLEIIVFPKSYVEYAALLQEDCKVFVRGRVSVKEDRDGNPVCNLICEQMISFEEAKEKQGPIFQMGRSGNGQGGGNPQSRPTARTLPKGVWVQFDSVDDYKAREGELFDLIADSDGNDNVVIFLRDTKQIRLLPANRCVNADDALKAKLSAIFGEENVKFRF
ncbi:MAG: hypothetical protein J6Q02_03130, partial [Lachnospiraceae bacterium]|nr:hypothetical protein [Lachnospiraceae bacterium]